MKSHKFEFTVSSPSEAVVELSDEGLYVRFKSGVESAQTIVRSRWGPSSLSISLPTAT